MSKELTCFSCLFSFCAAGDLFCDKHEGLAVSKCKDFVYEPGTDEVIKRQALEQLLIQKTNNTP